MIDRRTTFLRASAAALLLLAAPGCKSSTEPDLPGTIHVCETNTATLCADWHLSGGVYTADWSQGSHAVIRVAEFGGDDVVFIRDDPSGTSVGMHAVYVGRDAGDKVENGLVVWTQSGFSFTGVWTATW